MIFQKESDFEEALIKVLISKGWEEKVLEYYTEKDLIKNWASILYENNRDIDRLNDYPLTDGEMKQILEQVNRLRTPLKLNSFINGKTVTITRDNPDDKLHLGKEISLKIYDRKEIAAGQSRYQIAKQPQFKSKSPILNDRRGDLMLLINGMPVIHIELKRTNTPVSQAYNQIEKYSDEGLFTGIFSLIQVFVAMEPNETVYFANPGPDGKFNTDFYFHWADFNNEPINNWKDVASSLLSIPMAHQLIGFYTVADDSDGILKVMRSYQYYAANAIFVKVSKVDWTDENLLGGYIWHTTGSGKTMTSFKSAQLISNSKDADKVVFLMDRIELGTQSLKEYRGFADEDESVQATENTKVLITKLKSTNPADNLIVTSIQKMSNIKDEADGLNANDIKIMNSKRIVFIVDECHRSTFGEMLITIKNTFPRAIFFGFTGTPILDENQKKLNTTTTVFGNELHRYSIADGIRDENVLGFDVYKVLTFKDKDIRKEIALQECKAQNEEEAINDEGKSKIYYKFMNDIKMFGYRDENNNYVKGIEDYLPNSQYRTEEHQKEVVKDILENWITVSRSGKFHAILATSSIQEAIEYYKLFREDKFVLKVACLVDPNIDNNGKSKFKEDGLVEIISDYNMLFEQKFSLATFDKFKKDIALRLAHKKPYTMINRTQQIDLLIVVDQMLTGFDSKWVNTLYLDKVLQYENIIQAFSRTNRLFGPDKPFGTIRYYRRPHTMEKNIEKAVKLYSGDKPVQLFVQKLNKNIKSMNEIYNEIKELFNNAGILNFEKLPNEKSERGKFATLFKKLNTYLEAARIQGFDFSNTKYKSDNNEFVEIIFDKKTYLILAKRYKELFIKGPGGGNETDAPFDIVGHLTEIDTGKIDSDYMNTRFEKYLRTLHQEGVSKEQLEKTLDELHKSFASLTQDEQKYANIFIHDIQSGNAIVQGEKTFRDYITEYQFEAKNKEIYRISNILGLDEKKLRRLMSLKVTANNINEFGRFDELLNTVDKIKAKAYFEGIENKELSDFIVNIKTYEFLRKFIIYNGFEVEIPKE